MREPKVAGGGGGWGWKYPKLELVDWIRKRRLKAGFVWVTFPLSGGMPFSGISVEQMFRLGSETYTILLNRLVIS